MHKGNLFFFSPFHTQAGDSVGSLVLQLLVQVTSASGGKQACCDLDLGPANLLGAAESFSLSLLHTCSTHSPAPIHASSFCFQYFSTLQHFSYILGTTQGLNTLCKFNACAMHAAVTVVRADPKVMALGE